MTDLTKLKELAERAHKLGRWYWNPSVDVYPDMAVDQDFMLAANPKAILGLIAEVERLREWYGNSLRMFSECAAALPGPYYMDPPDGGDVSIPEQLRRMAKDAERYRWLCASAWYVGPEPRGDIEAVSWHDRNDTRHGVTTAIDAALEGGKDDRP